MVLLTKSDLADKVQIGSKLKVIGKVNKNVFPVSIYDENSLINLKKLILDVK